MCLALDVLALTILYLGALALGHGLLLRLNRGRLSPLDSEDGGIAARSHRVKGGVTGTASLRTCPGLGGVDTLRRLRHLALRLCLRSPLSLSLSLSLSLGLGFSLRLK